MAKKKTSAVAEKAEELLKEENVVEELVEAFAEAQERSTTYERAAWERRKRRKELEEQGVDPEEAQKQALEEFPNPTPTKRKTQRRSRRPADEIVTMASAIAAATDPFTGKVSYATAMELLKAKGLNVSGRTLADFAETLGDSPVYRRYYDALRLELLEDVLEAHEAVRQSLIERARDPEQTKFDKLKDQAQALALLFEQAQAIAGANVIKHEVEHTWKPEFIEVVAEGEEVEVEAA
jgi:hypothetical protein